MTASDGEHGAELVIENDGRELTETETIRLTEAFHRGEQTRLAGRGTGLGLTLADTAARALGGTLTLSPRPGGGLIARLAIPHPEDLDLTSAASGWRP